MLINHNINNFVGGVSQQGDELRFDNQVEEMVNFYPTVAEGLRRRNPTQFVANLTDVTFQENMAIHSYSRDDNVNEFGFILDSVNGLKAFTKEGVSKTVTDSSGIIDAWKLISGIDWKRDIQFLTVGDTTWLLNRKLTTAMTSATTPAQGTNTVFFWVKRSFKDTDGAGYTYTATVDGQTISVNNADSEVAANRLVNGYDSGSPSVHTNGLKDLLGTTNYTYKVVGSLFMIKKNNGTNVSYASSDSWGNQAMVAWKGEIARLSDLPADLSGFTESEVGVIKITGSDKDNFASYYIKWNGENWTETVAPGTKTTIDNTKMPVKLVMNSDTSFRLEYITWDERKKGDEDSNPLPSFISTDTTVSRITNMFFYKNRLGFTSGESVILSEVGQYGNFFATTVMEILDSDVIDVTIDSDSTANISFVNVSAGGLTIWSSSGQFLLTGGEVLSPETTRVSRISAYSSDATLQPVAVDNEIIFFNKIGSYLDVLSYAPATIEADRTTSTSLTSHIPSYIPSNLKTVVNSSAHDTLLLLPYNSSEIYCYKYFVRGGEKVISAWFKWTFDDVIDDINIMSNVLYILTGTNTLCKMDLKPQDIDGSFLDVGTTTYESKVVMSRYNVMTEQQSRAIREPFYIKNVKIIADGDIDIDIINEERISTKTINTKHKSRRIFIGGNSNKINIGFRTSRETGCYIGVVSVEGIIKTRSRNI